MRMAQVNYIPKNSIVNVSFSYVRPKFVSRRELGRSIGRFYDIPWCLDCVDVYVLTEILSIIFSLFLFTILIYSAYKLKHWLLHKCIMCYVNTKRSCGAVVACC